MKLPDPFLCACAFLLPALPLPAANAGRPVDITCDMLATPGSSLKTGQKYVIRGTVEDVVDDETDPTHVFLILRDRGVSIPVAINRAKLDYPMLCELVGAEVSICGTVLSPIVQTGRPHREQSFDVQSPENITVLRPSPDPFQVPDLRTDSTIGPRELAAMGRRRICGHVLATWQNRNVLLRSSEDQLVGVEMSEAGVPAVGEFVEVVGLPETDLYRINLLRAIWRPTDPFPVREETPVSVSAADIMESSAYAGLVRPNFHGKVIRMSGRILAISTPPDGQKLIHLESGGRVVLVRAAFAAPLPDGAAVGCRAEFTGRCVMVIDNWQPRAPFPKNRGFEVIVNAPSGIRVISRVPWWTPARLFPVIASLLAVLVGIFIWNITLRRLANRRGRELARSQLTTLKSQLQVEERTRLAVELHDTIAQNLTGVSMEIEAANDLRGAAPEPMLRHLGVAAKALKSCRDELRNCLWDLRSQALEEKDMTSAILRTLQPHANDANLAVRFNVPRARLSDNTAHALLRIIRALTVNALRHGGATTVRIAGAIDGDRLLCSVTDNGRGFDPDLAPGIAQGHFGLQGIRERLDELGGEFTLDGAPGRGVRATVSLPIPKEKPQWTR